MDYFFNGLQFVGGLILTFGYVPQIIKIFKTKSVKDFSLNYALMLSLGIFLMELYAIYNAVKGVATMFLITNTIAWLCELIMLTLILVYRKRTN